MCLNCGRSIYTNDIDLCKRCYQEVGLEFLGKEEEVEEVEEGPSMEELGLEPTEGSQVLESDSEEEKEEEKKE